MPPAIPPHPLDPALPVYGYAPADPAAPPAVSIITPYYNTGPIFLDTIRSVLRQSLQQWEWIIVNDGSDDRAALQVLAPLRASPDPRIRVVDQPNRGLAAARNAGVAASRAPLLFFLDSDDLIAPTALEQLAWSLASHPGSACAAPWCATFGTEHVVWRRGFDARHTFPHDNVVSPNVMLRRTAFDRVGGFNEQLQRYAGLEDYELWVRLAAAGLWGHDVREVLLWLRRKPRQAYTSYHWSFHDDRSALRRLRGELRARYPDLFRNGPPPPPGDPAPLLEAHALMTLDAPFANRLQPPQGRGILVLAPWVEIGGADRFGIDLVAGLRARGCRVTVCLLRLSANPWIEEMRRAAGELFNLPACIVPADYPRFLRYLIESRAISTILVHNDLLAYRLLPFLRAHCPHASIMDFLHLEQEQYHGGMPRAALEHSALIDLHLTASQHLRCWMIERGADPARVEPCTINIDTQRWRPDPVTRIQVRAELGLNPDQPVILFAGRLAPQKQPRLAVEVLRMLARRGMPFTCLVVGDGPDMRWMRRFVRRHRLGGHVRLFGAQPSGRVRDLMAASDLFLLPSAHEGIALTLYEAMAMGVVPVAADVGGQRELVTPECGVLIPPGNDQAAQYADALQHLLADPERRAVMAAAARARVVERFDRQQMLDRMLALISRADTLAAEAPRPPVDPGTGLAAASLAIEYFRFREGLLELAPVSLARMLRWSSAWPALQRLSRARILLNLADRRVYVARREVMWRIKRLLGRPYNQ
ncbi:MAG: glycosyltransferase [Chloroflexi bacterium]|nr:glycosyltransferase [Chloroflexota bacterium]